MEEQNMDLFEKLERMTLKLHIGENAGNTDKGYFQLFEEGEKENDLHKIYEFVNGLERGNLARPHKEFTDCFTSAWEQDEKRTIEILNKKERIIDCVFLAYSLHNEKKLQLVCREDIKNSRLKFELIRQLLAGKPEYTEDNMETIKQGIIQLAELDINLFAFMIKKLEHNKNFFPVMGKALNDLSEDGLNVYADTICIDKYKHNFSEVNRMWEEVRDDRWYFIFGNLQKTICAKWENLLATCLEKEEYFNDIVISSYANLILFCMIHKYQNEDLLIQDLEKALDIFENHLFAWHSSYSRAMSVYFIDITRLYMFKLVLTNHKISWENREELKKRLQSMFGEARRHGYYWKYAETKADDILGLEVDTI